MMNRTTTAVSLALVFASGSSATAPKNSATPSPFECTSIHPEVCELEEQLHMLRFEQAHQRAAIVEAEPRRRAEIATRVSTDDAFPTESPVPETTAPRPHRARL